MCSIQEMIERLDNEFKGKYGSPAYTMLKLILLQQFYTQEQDGITFSNIITSKDILNEIRNSENDTFIKEALDWLNNFQPFNDVIKRNNKGS